MVTELDGAVVLAGDFRDLKNVEVVQPKARAFLPFKALYEFDAEQAYVSDPQHNGDWGYYFVIRVVDWREATGDDHESKYNVGLHAVSPQAAGLRAVMQAVKSAGFARDYFERLEGRQARQQALVEMLVQYGTTARLTDDYGDNLRDLMRDARQEAFKARSLLGFYMDRRQNAFGDTGWDFVRGNVAGSRDREHQRYLEDHGLTEDEFQAQREKRAEESAKVVIVPAKLEPYIDGKKPMDHAPEDEWWAYECYRHQDVSPSGVVFDVRIAVGNDGLMKTVACPVCGRPCERKASWTADRMGHGSRGDTP
jgi:hypothetical protein